MAAVLRYLDTVDPEAAKIARQRYACFDQFRADARVYGFLTASGVSPTCAEEVVSQLVDLQRRAAEAAQRGAGVDADALFDAEQNARVAKNAEAYYRSAFLSDVSSWNLRDRHMTETLEALIAHLAGTGAPDKVVVWAHNSHLGDARATEMSDRGELNIGQLVRERHGRDALLVGFTTHHGTVTAASDWDGPAERKRVRPALTGSYESTFHSARLERFLLPCRDNAKLPDAVRRPQLERAIGVIYRPDTERMSHYFRARLHEQFDAVLHFDETTAVEPLERSAQWDTGELPETYPFAV
jgi:erythromycin esterase-like protein